MLLTELITDVFTRSGQYISVDPDLGELDSIDLKMEPFWRMVYTELKYFQQYFPLEKRFNIEISSGYGNFYSFATDVHNVGYVDNLTPGEPPEHLSQITPVGAIQLFNILANAKFGQNAYSPNSLSTPRVFKCEYRKPNLYATEAGPMDVLACYNYQIIRTLDENDILVEVEIVDFNQENEQYFYDLITGRFMIMVGRSRSSFTHHDLQIEVDGKDLIEAGTEIYKGAREAIADNHNWFLSVRP